MRPRLKCEAAESASSLAQNFDTFLTLLTAQLQNQDPLKPVDSTEFTNQLVQFSGVEQQIETNKSLGDLISLTASSTAAGLAGYLGKTVEIDSREAELGQDGINWLYEMPKDTANASLAIQSEAGKIVYSEDIDTVSGAKTFTWNGKQLSGADLESGKYSLIVRAEDSAGEALDVPVRVRAEVSGVDLSTGTTSISTGAGLFGFEQVLRLMSMA